MINRIKSIKNLGIYKNYNAESDLKEFNKYNLFYGWNGSGKTTISKLFRILEKKQLSNEQNELKFDIEINSQKYTERDFMSHGEKVFVFNEEFINENIKWDEKINKILLLSKDKITELDEFDKLKEELEGNDKIKGLNETVNSEKHKLNAIVKEIEDAYSKIAKNIKNIFQTIDPSDKEYSTLNKTKIQKELENREKLDLILNTNFSEDEIKKLTLSIKTDKKEIIKNEKKNLEKDYLIDFCKEINAELMKLITAKVIDRLKNYTEIAIWVNKGIEIHKKYNNSVCEFCGNEISQERILSLEEHFNDEVSKSKDILLKMLEKIKIYEIEKTNIIVEKNMFYKEYAFEIEALNYKIVENINQINEIIQVIENKIKEKIENPFVQIKLDFIENFEKILEEYNINVDMQKEYVKKNNQKTANFETQIKQSKNELYNYYLKEQYESENIVEKFVQYESYKKIVSEKTTELNNKKQRLSVLEAILSNEILGAENFNDKLKVFLGYDELKLQFNKELKGYEIIRKSTGIKASHLSEGEKTAIAFIYFLTKLKENNNRIDNSIIVIDDPISSFDNNKLFNAYSSIKYELESAKQLFILTHNFNFYKLIRDWIKKQKDSNDNKAYSIYKIEVSIKDNIRIGNIKNAGKSLNQTSEYDYVFAWVYNYKGKELKENDIFNCGNACRKLLEAFLSFKFPKQRGDIQSLLDKAFSAETEIQMKERVYKFINTYSHLNVIETTEAFDIDTILSESKGIVDIILNKIETLDDEHYKAMVHNAESTAQI